MYLSAIYKKYHEDDETSRIHMNSDCDHTLELEQVCILITVHNPTSINQMRYHG